MTTPFFQVLSPKTLTSLIHLFLLNSTPYPPQSCWLYLRKYLKSHYYPPSTTTTLVQATTSHWILVSSTDPLLPTLHQPPQTHQSISSTTTSEWFCLWVRHPLLVSLVFLHQNRFYHIRTLALDLPSAWGTSSPYSCLVCILTSFIFLLKWSLPQWGLFCSSP